MLWKNHSSKIWERIKELNLLYVMIESILFFLIIYFYNTHIQLVQGTSGLFSSDIAYRLQTDAFLKAKLSLSSHPFGLPFDYIWTGHAMHQNWGLGVPLLRLPFEWGAQLCGWGPFPDRLTLFFYLILMVIILNVSIRRVLGTFGIGGYSAGGLLLRWYLTALVLFSPSMSDLLFRTGSNVYEEAVFYGCIYSYTLLALFWLFMRRPNDKFLFIICLFSGLAWVIRPTLIFYGVITAVLTIIYSYLGARHIRPVVWGIVGFCCGAFVDLLLNYFRFGSFFEFGYSASIDGIPVFEYPLRFDNFFDLAPFLPAAKELIGGLFFNNSWKCDLVRWRHYWFAPFNILHLLILVAGLISVILYFMLAKYRLSMGIKKNLSIRIIFFTYLWGFVSFSGLFLFYLRCPALTSRYLSDFSAAFNAVFISLIFLGLFLFSRHRRNNNWVFVILSFFVFSMLFYLNNRAFLQKKTADPDVTSQEGVKLLVSAFNKGILFESSLHDKFLCGNVYSVRGLPFQFNGWNTGDCLVEASTDIFLPAKGCLFLNYSILYDKQRPKIRVKRDFIFLKSLDSRVVNDVSKRNLNITESFCSNASYENNISLYSVAWISANKFRRGKIPIRLNWVGSADQEGYPKQPSGPSPSVQ